MAVISIPHKTSATITLNGGTDSNGKAIHYNVNLNDLAASPNGDKIMAVVDAAAEVLDNPVAYVRTTEVNTLEHGA